MEPVATLGNSHENEAQGEAKGEPAASTLAAGSIDDALRALGLWRLIVCMARGDAQDVPLVAASSSSSGGGDGTSTEMRRALALRPATGPGTVSAATSRTGDLREPSLWKDEAHGEAPPLPPPSGRSHENLIMLGFPLRDGAGDGEGGPSPSESCAAGPAGTTRLGVPSTRSRIEGVLEGVLGEGTWPT